MVVGTVVHVPSPAAAGGDPVVRTIAITPRAGGVWIDHRAAPPALMVERKVGHGANQGAVGHVESAVAVKQMVDRVINVAGMPVGVDQVDPVGLVRAVARVWADVAGAHGDELDRRPPSEAEIVGHADGRVEIDAAVEVVDAVALGAEEVGIVVGVPGGQGVRDFRAPIRGGGWQGDQRGPLVKDVVGMVLGVERKQATIRENGEGWIVVIILLAGFGAADDHVVGGGVRGVVAGDAVAAVPHDVAGEKRAPVKDGAFIIEPSPRAVRSDEHGVAGQRWNRLRIEQVGPRPDFLAVAVAVAIAIGVLRPRAGTGGRPGGRCCRHRRRHR